MSSVKRSFVLFLLVLFLSSCISAISLVEERKITAVVKAAAGGGHGGGGAHGGGGSGAHGGGGSEAGGSNEGGGGNGEGSRTPSGVIPAVVVGGAGAANARHGARKHNAATISHAQPIYIPLVAAMLGVAILLFV
ncbi:serine, glycine, tyrosine and glutamine-rich protein-like [Dioscorea cayenensis subsp. rotundata]|uniref:Serine, glycine, tyrosine and glutamine-rich protein-like n=1 Tax=Dioscorea cayennensis subsp. rotundata TaxID=55577 RepID=A0AB40BEJ4_DIOCR|nr:serine, glycine, tyrosine and glutamine-rich protein-like [Dioscorea cayenensis subsp. rotundata]